MTNVNDFSELVQMSVS